MVIFFFFTYLLVQEGTNSENFEASIFVCIGDRIRISDTSSLAIEVSSEKPWISSLLKQAIRWLSQSMALLLVHFRGQSLIHIEKFADCFSGKW